MKTGISIYRFNKKNNYGIISLLVFYLVILVNFTTTAQEQTCIPLSEVMDYHVSYEIHSPNNKYSATIAGGMYEGFYGKQIISLIIDKYWGRRAWSKLISNKTHIPAVSDSGEVAIINGNKYDIYNKKGDLVYSYIPKNEREIYGVGEYIHPVHSFSSTNGCFYTILDSAHIGGVNNIPQLLTCINKKGEQVWQRNIGVYYPTRISIASNIIILDNIGNEGVMAPYIISLFNESGELLEKIILSKNIYLPPVINKNKSSILLFDSKKNKIISYSIQNKSVRSELSQKEAIELLFSKNLFEVSFALSFIDKNLDAIEITNKAFKKINKLSHYNRSREYFSPTISSKSMSLIDKIYNK